MNYGNIQVLIETHTHIANDKVLLIDLNTTPKNSVPFPVLYGIGKIEVLVYPQMTTHFLKIQLQCIFSAHVFMVKAVNV